MSVPAGLGRLASALADTDAVRDLVASRVGSGGRQAAVLILLGSLDDGGYEVVLMEKRPDLRSHAGQVAFPGGTRDDADADAIATALREAEEEVGVAPEGVQVLGVLPPARIVITGFDVTAVIAWWRRPIPLRPVDLTEVAAVHRIPIGSLVDPDNRITWVHPSGFRGPGFVIGDLFVWGFTAFLLDGLLELAGWAQPWDAERTSSIPDRFLSGRRFDG